ncbi:MAG: DUF305 domain-containing protein [Sediminibacterium sp.]
MDSIQMKNDKSYRKFYIMLGLSFAAMYGTMYLNTYSIDHVYFSMTRLYMTCLGISVMGLIMLMMMKVMYTNKIKNAVIVIGSVLLFSGALLLMRLQSPVIGDVLYMKGMIPHHSIAILTSERADIRDPEVRTMADGIIAAQKKEIEEMKNLIKRLENDK